MPGSEYQKLPLGKIEPWALHRAFGPKDTIYLSVASEGVTPRTTLGVRWTFGPKEVLVKEETAALAPPSAKPMVTEFHITKPSGWPPGTYKVALTVDGQPSQTKSFTVAKR